MEQVKLYVVSGPNVPMREYNHDCISSCEDVAVKGFPSWLNSPEPDSPAHALKYEPLRRLETSISGATATRVGDMVGWNRAWFACIQVEYSAPTGPFSMQLQHYHRGS